MLEPRSRFLFVLLAIAVLVSVALTYWETMIRQDFVVINDVEDTSLDAASSEAP